MKNLFRLVPVVFLALAGSRAYAVDSVLKETEAAYVQLTKDIRPFVVNIDTKGTSKAQEGGDQRRFNEMFRFFGIPFGPEGMPNMPTPHGETHMALGSGFIYDKEGHIITNNHMVEGADEIHVKLSNGKEYDATIVGRDPDTDLAVIKIKPDGDLPVAPLGDSDKLEAGQYAIACGSPRGFEGSFTFGHVSAVRRNELNLPGLRFENFIQTDAAINLGNSGGPLCDINGQVIGINIAIVYGANAIGFAIPVNTAKQVIPELISKGKVTRGFLGVGVTDAQPFKDAVGLPDDKGAFVKTVQPDSPADKAGIKPYDVIRTVNGSEITAASNLVQNISDLAPGATAKLGIWRDKKEIEVDVKLGEFPASGKEVVPAKEALGLHVENITPDTASSLQLKPGTAGVIITDVDPASAAADAGLTTGDIITEVAQQPVKNTDEFSKAMKENATAGKSLLIGFIRNGQHDITVVKVPK